MPGLPIPPETERIDLAVSPGTPGLIETLQAVLSEMTVEKVILAEETKVVSPELHQQLEDMLSHIEWESTSHEKLKAMSRQAKAVIRTGECTSYANVVLQSGVAF